MTPYLGLISIFGFNFAPRGWMLCQGQLLSISQNSALFSLLGTTYGGNGITVFGLPDFRSRVPIGMGQGPGLSSYVQGEMSGSENVTILSTQMPAHPHFMMASGDGPTQATVQGASLGSQSRSGGSMPAIYANGATTQVAMASGTSVSGGSQPHENLQPYLTLNFSIAMEGIYPSRN